MPKRKNNPKQLELRLKPARGAYKHGESHPKPTPEWLCWSSMISRCYVVKNHDYPWYGARGITVCDEWREYVNFLRDMGRRPSSKHSLDRIDNNGNYCKENCRWVTREQQMRNRRNTLQATFCGQTKPLITWCEQLGLRYKSVFARLKNGWTIEHALTTPIQTAYRRSRKQSDFPR